MTLVKIPLYIFFIVKQLLRVSQEMGGHVLNCTKNVQLPY